MKKIITLIVFTLCFIPLSYAKNRVVIGKIASFSCGDNCYLTIIDKQGKEHNALCNDTICEILVEHQDDPNLAGYKGKMVKVIINQGKQYDGAGNEMGTMDAFKKIQVLK